MIRNRKTLAFIVAGFVVVIAVAWGLIGRRSAIASLEVTAAQTATPPVQVIYPQRAARTHTLDLPGNVVAWYEAPIYAQVSGYVKMWYVDYGAKVTRGQLLAIIDAPELDQQYQAAKAQLAVAQTKYKIASLTAKRYGALSGTQAVSQQEVDVEIADAAAGLAQVQAAQDDVARYAALEAFKQVVAPFSGVVTARETDVGDYVSAAGGDVGSGGKSTELFSVADVHEMRVFVDVPQDDASALQSGLTASVQLPQFPDKVFKANFLTTAGAFNPQTRTVTTELTIQNPHDTIWPGSYADVRLVVPSDPNVLVIPEQALLFRAQGLQVAVVGPDNAVHLRDVKLGLNLGSSVQVVSGLRPADRIIDNPSDGLLEGQHVRIVPGVPGVALASRETQPPAAGTQMANRN